MDYNKTTHHMKIFDDSNFPFDISKMRDLTPEENDSIKRYIDSISIDTGINVFDISDTEVAKEDNENG